MSLLQAQEIPLSGSSHHSFHANTEHKTGSHLSGKKTNLVSRKATKVSHRQWVVVSETNIEKTQTRSNLAWPLKSWNEFSEFWLLSNETGSFLPCHLHKLSRSNEKNEGSFFSECLCVRGCVRGRSLNPSRSKDLNNGRILSKLCISCLSFPFCKTCSTADRLKDVNIRTVNHFCNECLKRLARNRSHGVMGNLKTVLKTFWKLDLYILNNQTFTVGTAGSKLNLSFFPWSHVNCKPGSFSVTR